MKSNQDFIDHTLKPLIKECRAAGPDFCAAGGVIKAPNGKQAGAKTITIAPVVTCPGAKKAGCIGACYACCGRYRFRSVAAAALRQGAAA